MFVFLIIINYHGQQGVIRRPGKSHSGGEKASLSPDFFFGEKRTIKFCNNNILDTNSAVNHTDYN